MNMRGLPLTPSDVFRPGDVRMPAAAVDTYASRWDDIMDPLGDDAARVEEFFRYLHLILTHKPATGKLIEDFLSDVLNQYLAVIPLRRSSTVFSPRMPWRGAFLSARRIPCCRMMFEAGWRR